MPSIVIEVYNKNDNDEEVKKEDFETTKPSTLEELKQIIIKRYPSIISKTLTISYTDEDGDVYELNEDEDLQNSDAQTFKASFKVKIEKEKPKNITKIESKKSEENVQEKKSEDENDEKDENEKNENENNDIDNFSDFDIDDDELTKRLNDEYDKIKNANEKKEIFDSKLFVQNCISQFENKQNELLNNLNNNLDQNINNLITEKSKIFLTSSNELISKINKNNISTCTPQINFNNFTQMTEKIKSDLLKAKTQTTLFLSQSLKFSPNNDKNKEINNSTPTGNIYLSEIKQPSQTQEINIKFVSPAVNIKREISNCDCIEIKDIEFKNVGKEKLENLFFCKESNNKDENIEFSGNIDQKLNGLKIKNGPFESCESAYSDSIKVKIKNPQKRKYVFFLTIKCFDKNIKVENPLRISIFVEDDEKNNEKEKEMQEKLKREEEERIRKKKEEEEEEERIRKEKEKEKEEEERIKKKKEEEEERIRKEKEKEEEEERIRKEKAEEEERIRKEKEEEEEKKKKEEEEGEENLPPDNSNNDANQDGGNDDFYNGLYEKFEADYYISSFKEKNEVIQKMKELKGDEKLITEWIESIM